MTARRLAVMAFFLTVGHGICHATLGDTEAQCIAKYGEESDVQSSFGYDVVGDRAASFQVKTPKGAMVMKVIFFHGAAAHESVFNADSSRGLSEEQMKAVLDSESAGQKWKKLKTLYRTDHSGQTAGFEDWLRDDGATARFWLSAQAGADGIFGEVEISTHQYAVAQSFLDKQDTGN